MVETHMHANVQTAWRQPMGNLLERHPLEMHAICIKAFQFRNGMVVDVILTQYYIYNILVYMI